MCARTSSNTVCPHQIHALLGEGHVNIIKAYDAMLTNSHLGLIMEYAAGGNLTSYVAKKYEHSKATGLFLSEHEARFLFKVCFAFTHGGGGYKGGLKKKGSPLSPHQEIRSFPQQREQHRVSPPPTPTAIRQRRQLLP